MGDSFLDTPLGERNVADVLEGHRRIRPDKTAVIGVDDRSLTYAELYDQGQRMAAGLDQLGLGRQDAVAVMLENHIDRVVMWAGANLGGFIEVTVNTAYKGDLLRHVLTNSMAATVVIEGNWCSRLAPFADQLTHIETLVIRGPADCELPPAWKVIDFAELGRKDAAATHRPKVSDISAIIYTSGTEGPSKGVLCPHGHAFATGTYPLTIRSDDVVLVNLPLFHAGGLWHGLYGALIHGATAVITRGFSTTEFWGLVRQYRCTKTILLGAMGDFLLRQPPSHDDLENTMECVCLIPASPGMAEELHTRFGMDVLTSYGSTEVGSICGTEPGFSGAFACGQARTHMEMRIVDEYDEEVPRGVRGEVIARSSEPWTMMAGYVNMPDATNRAWRNLWFHTGDMLYQDEEGSYWYAGRKNDAIRRRGENVSAFEVEQALQHRPDIAEAAVVPVASEHTEQEIKAVLVAVEGVKLDFQAILVDMYDRLPYFMVPRYYEVTDALPRTPTLKVQKEGLRASGVSDDCWDCQEAGYFITRSELRSRQRA